MNPFVVDETVIVIAQHLDHYRDLVAFIQINRRCNRHGKKVPIVYTLQQQYPDRSIQRSFFLGRELFHMTINTSRYRKEYFYLKRRLVRKIKKSDEECKCTEHDGKIKRVFVQCPDEFRIMIYKRGVLRHYYSYDRNGKLIYESYNSKRGTGYGQRSKEIYYTETGEVEKVMIHNGRYTTKRITYTPSKEVKLISFFKKHPQEWSKEDVSDWFDHLLITPHSTIDGKELLSLTDNELYDLSGDPGLYYDALSDLQARLTA